MSVRAKFYVAEITKLAYAAGASKVVLIATSRKEGDNKDFWEATPSGRIELTLSAKGESAGVWFADRLGQDVYLDFTEVSPGDTFATQYEKSPRSHA